MKRYILIGGMGSGKSTAAQCFAQQGAFCIDLDKIGHRVLLQADVHDALVEAFGKDILDDREMIDHRALAAAAFATPEATETLNRITHPAILEAARTQLEGADGAGVALAIVEASAFNGSESPFMDLLQEGDGIIAVVAPEELRIERAIARGMDRADAQARLARQPRDEQRRVWADYVLENDGSLDELEARIRELIPQLLAS